MSSMHIILTILVLKFHLSLQCTTYFGSITCKCSNESLECSGVQMNITDMQDLLLNISYTDPEYFHNVTLNVQNLQFELDFTFHNMKIQNLSIHHGLDTINSHLFSGVNSSLQHLNLQYNNIREILNQPFSSLFHLRELMLDYNELEQLYSEMFINLTNLEYFSVTNNNLTNISSNVFQQSSYLKTLVITGNNFSSIPDIGLNSSSLLHLHADNCSLSGALEKISLSGVPRLLFLDMSQNMISDVKSYSLHDLKYLKFLNLSFNSIKTLEENAFSSLQNLTKLDLKSNSISYIKRTAFSYLVNLEELDISENRLTALLCEYTSDMLHLQKLFLQNNFIRLISYGAFYYSPRLMELNLDGNNLECSCELTRVTDFIRKNTSVTHDITCTKSDSTTENPDLCHTMEPCRSNVLDDSEDYDEDVETLTGKSTDVTAFMSTVETLRTTTTEVKSTESTNVTTSEDIEKTSYSIVSTTFSPSVDTTSEKSISSEKTDDSFVSTVSLTEESNITTALSILESTTFTPTIEKSSTLDISTSTVSDFDVSGNENISTTVSTSYKSDATKSSVLSTKVLNTNADACSALVFPSETISSDFHIIQNSSYIGKTFCLKWSFNGTMPSDSRCHITYTFGVSRIAKITKCSMSFDDVKTWSVTKNISQVCILITIPKDHLCIDLMEMITTSIDTIPTDRFTVPAVFHENATVREALTSPVFSHTIQTKTNSNSAQQTSDKADANASLIPLLCLLIIVLLVVFIVVFKNICRKRLETSKYEVQLEEGKAQKRISCHDSSGVRYSYIAREKLEA